MVEKLELINTEDIPKSGPWTKLAVTAVSGCTRIKKEREKEILFDRFGIGKSPRTLQAIGQKYSVTRERIRQIVNNAIKKIQKSSLNPDLKAKLQTIEKLVSDNGGVASFGSLTSKLKIVDRSEKNAFKFLTALSNNLEILKESNIFKQSLMIKGTKISKIKEVVKKSTNFLKEKEDVATTTEIANSINEKEELVNAALSSVKNTMQADSKKWGLTSWPHVNPKSIRDKSKFIMIRHGKPLHYSELTKKIGEMGQKSVTRQSVHNELIKNKDFVLVGRGIYALTEWGYAPGVVEEVIYNILSEAGEPLHKDDIVKKVLEKRIVKVSTIVLNLQKPRFKRVGKAVYTIN